MNYSAVIIAKNESEKLEDCLSSIAGAAEIIVVDDESTDNTTTIAAKYGAKVLHRKLDGFATQKNFGIDKTTSDWVLIIDADERLTPELAAEIGSLKPNHDFDGYEMAFRNHLGSVWLRHGGLYPDYHTRLFNRHKVRYGLREVHELLDIDADKVGRLGHDIIHLTYRNAGDYLRKVKKYASHQAAEDARLGQATSQPALRAAIRESYFRFFKLGGYKDGFAGLVSALLLGYYGWLYQGRLGKSQ